MRIGLLTSSYPRHRADPAGSFVAAMARWLARGGDAVEVLAPAPAGGWTGGEGISVRPVRYALRPALFYGAGAPDNLSRSWRARWQAPAFVASQAMGVARRASGWTHLMSHWLVPCGLAGRVGAPRLPHLAVAHSSDVHLLARLPGAGALLHGLARGRARLLCTCAAIRDKLLAVCATGRARRWVRGAELMRMGIEPFDAPPVGDRPRTVLFLGRLVPVKGVDLLLRAMTLLPDVELVVAGDGPQRPGLEALARQLGVSARFAGEVAGEAKASLLATAGVLALPSLELPDGRTDAAPVVLLEAMAAGLPAVATRVGGNAELIQHETNGLLVPPEDPRALAHALANALDHGPTLAAAALDTARRHTWDTLTPRVRQILTTL